MIKGINRQVIEVTEIGNAYYERALLVVKPEYASLENAKLEREAKKVLKELGTPSSIQKKNRVLYWTVRLGAAAAFGSAVTALFVFV